MSSASANPSTQDDAQDVKRLALQLAAVVDVLERRSADAVGAIDDGRVALSRAVGDLGAHGQQLVEDIGRHAQAETKAAADRALGESVAAFKTQIDAASRQAKDSAEQLDVQRRDFARQQRSMLWIGAGALLIGSALAVAGSAAWVAVKRDEAARFDFAKQIYEATEAGALAPCGDELCVRVPANPRRAGERGEYLIVE